MARGTLLTLMGMAALVVACSGKDPYAPGDAVGSFHVTGKLVSASCGTTPNPWEFDVRLRHDKTTLYWVQGGAPIQGRVDDASRAVFTATSQYTLREADAKTKTPACVVARTDTLDMTLMADGTKATIVESTNGFTGTITYHYAPDGDAECGDQVGTTFANLPCDVTYDVTGAKSGN